MRILIPLHGFVDWNGGLDLIRLLSAAFQAVQPPTQVEIAFAMPQKTAPEAWLSGFLRRLRAFTSGARNTGAGNERGLRQTAREITNGWPVIFVSNTASGIVSAGREWGADVIFPTMLPLGASGPKRVGYIFDFQHRYLPDYFSPRTRRNRDRKFQAIIDDSDAIVVNADFVKRDLVNFLGVDPTKVLALPFAPHAQRWWFDIPPAEARKRYGLSSPYLLICNHFWKHKDHETALHAFALLRQRIECDVHLVMTGDPVDHRDPRHFSRLIALSRKLGVESYTRFLGLVPKRDQLSLMRGCIALIQPTRFEGGPGGGSVYEAIGFDVPAIVSDIPVNREVDQGDVRFFRVGDPSELVDRIVDVLENPKMRRSESELLKAGRSNLVRLGKAMLQHLTLLQSGD